MTQRKYILIALEYDQHEADWEKRIKRVVIDGEESSLDRVRNVILGFQTLDPTKGLQERTNV